MALIQEGYQLYSAKDYRKRVLLGMAMWTLVCKETVFSAANKYCKSRGKTFSTEIISRIRGFSSDADFLTKFRIKPCVPIMAMIYYRTANFSSGDFRARIANYHKMTKALTERGYFVPG